MNENHINYQKYQSRIKKRDSINRLSEKNNTEITSMDSSKDLNKTIISDMSDESLIALKNDLAIQLAEFSSEQFEITTQIKKINKVLKLRIIPLLDS